MYIYVCIHSLTHACAVHIVYIDDVYIDHSSV